MKSHKLSQRLFLALALTASKEGVTMELNNDRSQLTAQLKSKFSETDAAIKRLGGLSSLPLTSRGSGFSNGSDDEEKKSLLQIHSDLKRVRLGTGKLLFGRLINRLVVTSESPVIVELDPAQGNFSEMRMMGTAHVASSPGRLQIDFQKLLVPSGQAVTLQATALDENGAFGLTAQVFSQKALMIGGAMASSFISGLAASQQSQSSNAFGFTQTQPTGRNAILQGVAQTAADQSKRLIDEASAEKPVLVIEAGTEVTIMIQDDVRF